MGQVSSTLRRGDGCYFHWCPGCEEMHPLPDGWTFDGNLEKPTFAPSFKHSWGGRPDVCCHYILTAGILNYCADSTHELAGKSVPLPPLPEWLKDAS
jgi:hypothetical protein